MNLSTSKCQFTFVSPPPECRVIGRLPAKPKDWKGGRGREREDSCLFTSCHSNICHSLSVGVVWQLFLMCTFNNRTLPRVTLSYVRTSLPLQNSSHRVYRQVICSLTFIMLMFFSGYWDLLNSYVHVPVALFMRYFRIKSRGVLNMYFLLLCSGHQLHSKHRDYFHNILPVKR